MAQWNAAARQAYHKEHPENFAGPDMSFPIKDGSDVEDAWNLAGHADDPEAVRAKIKAIAKRLGLQDSLPKTAKAKAKEEQQERAMGTTLDRAAASHEPMTGTHSHAHPAFGSQGDDASHEHEHSHDNDNNHEHSHAEERSVDAPRALSLYAPIVRVDADAWIVEGQATSEAIDSYGTVFEYESSKRAFQEWVKRGNIREQHDPRKAVGKALSVEFDDANKVIMVRARISKGARDTWEKILDGTLSGFSIGAYPDAKVRYIDRGSKRVPMYYDHHLAELSVVDAPGSPNCDIRPILRADGVCTDIVDDADGEEPPQQQPEPEPSAALERAGARVSNDTRDKMHTSIAHTLHAAVSQMQNCGCDSCMKAQSLIDPDNDGDIDIGSFDDPDGDAESLYTNQDGEMERSIIAIVERTLAPVYSRLQAIAGTLARVQPAGLTQTPTAPSTESIERIVASAVTRAVADLPQQSSFDEVRSALAEVRGLVDKIAETPVPGMPVMNAGATPRPVDKTLPTDPYARPLRSGSAVYDAVSALASTGHLDSVERQVDAVAAALAAQRRG